MSLRRLPVRSDSCAGSGSVKFFALGTLIPLCGFSYLGNSGGNEVALFANILFFSSATALYFFPSICAIGHPREVRISIFKLNLLAGWTGIGWFLAFYRALVLPAADE
ncbi:superinfection immunity protein [Pseudomonas fluorescens group sp.]|nr:superinfection immunity protein [Pseudomonas fluorescens group sp.]MBZ6456689.1 superinfection immunity protein [Pseudomonas fluorescens group sp.]MBZ6462636.1 superinfection immunity protein [Pseudomonas fluorescens group sp.]MBZ6468777.1 superinfection immunity protein [Pseudomonas fluorescens group sp.]